jgi:hypothetical protein
LKPKFLQLIESQELGRKRGRHKDQINHKGSDRNLLRETSFVQCHQLLVDHCRLQDFANTIKCGKLLLDHHLLQSSAKAILALSIVPKQKTRINFVHHHIHEANSAKADS